MRDNKVKARLGKKNFQQRNPQKEKKTKLPGLEEKFWFVSSALLTTLVQPAGSWDHRLQVLPD